MDLIHVFSFLFAGVYFILLSMFLWWHVFVVDFILKMSLQLYIEGLDTIFGYSGFKTTLLSLSIPLDGGLLSPK